MKVKEYRIITRGTINGLSHDVNIWISLGWLPVGSPVQENSKEGLWHQAMILPEKEEKKSCPSTLNWRYGPIPPNSQLLPHDHPLSVYTCETPTGVPH